MTYYKGVPQVLGTTSDVITYSIHHRKSRSFSWMNGPFKARMERKEELEAAFDPNKDVWPRSLTVLTLAANAAMFSLAGALIFLT